MSDPSEPIVISSESESRALHNDALYTSQVTVKEEIPAIGTLVGRRAPEYKREYSGPNENIRAKGSTLAALEEDNTWSDGDWLSRTPDKAARSIRQGAVGAIYEDTKDFVSPQRKLIISGGSEFEGGSLAALISGTEQLNLVVSIGGGYRAQELDKNCQHRIVAANEILAETTPRYTISKPLKVGEEFHISFKRPDEVMRLANSTLRKDSLVITIDIDAVELGGPSWEIAKMLTDTGSAIDILYLGTLKKMGLDGETLMDPIEPLTGFAGKSIWPVGLINLTVNVAGVHISTLFHVVDAYSSYNGILGRVWLERLGAVSSPMHRCLKFYSSCGKYITVHAHEGDSFSCSIETAKTAKTTSGDKPTKQNKKRKQVLELKDVTINGEEDMRV